MTTPELVGICFQKWPGRREDLKSQPSVPVAVTSLVHSRLLVMVGASELGAETDEHLGIVAAYETIGPSVLRAWLVVPDDRQDVLTRLRAAAKRQPIESPVGTAPIYPAVLTAREFCDPRSGPLYQLAYRGGATVVGVELARTIGLLCGDEWTADKTGGGFTCYPVGTSSLDPSGRRKSLFPHSPPIRISRRGIGALIGFARPPGGKGYGKRDRTGRPTVGRFIDVLTASYSLTGVASAALAEHLEAWSLDTFEAPPAVSLDSGGAETMLAVTEAAHRLALTVDEDAGKWATTAAERSRSVMRIDLSRLYSPGGLASQIIRCAGVAPLLAKFDRPDDEHLGRWLATMHGGWCTAELAGAGAFPAADIDVTSAYPSAFALLGGWRMMTAERLDERDTTVAVRCFLDDLAGKVADDPAGALEAVCDPALYRRFGCTLVEVIPAGDELPIDIDDGQPSGFELVPVHSAAQLPATFYDVVHSVLRTGRAPEIVTAMTLRAVGRQADLAGVVHLYDGLSVPIAADPIAALVERRARARSEGDDRLARHLRILVNAGCWGNLARLDEIGTGPKRSERPDLWTFPPLAASIPAVLRLVLGTAELMIRKQGGTVASRDTDGLLLVASPEGGSCDLVRQATFRRPESHTEAGAISFAALDEVLARFDRLVPLTRSTKGRQLTGHPGRHFWSVVREPGLRGLVTAKKRWSIWEGSGVDVELIEFTEHSLAGSVLDPPTMAGKRPDGKHVWAAAVAARQARRVDAVSPSTPGLKDRDQVWPVDTDWDLDDEASQFPAIRTYRCTAPKDVLASRSIGISHVPFGRGLTVRQYDQFVDEVSLPIFYRLDDGTASDNWRKSIWSGPSGRVRILTEASVDAVDVKSLDTLALEWTNPRYDRAPESHGPINVSYITLVGRSGAALDAVSSGDEFDKARIGYGFDATSLVDLCGSVNRLGPTALARRLDVSESTVRRIRNTSVTAPLRRSTEDKIRTALRAPDPSRPCACGCEEPITRTGQLYASDACRMRFNRARLAATRAPAVLLSLADFSPTGKLPSEMADEARAFDCEGQTLRKSQRWLDCSTPTKSGLRIFSHVGSTSAIAVIGSGHQWAVATTEHGAVNFEVGLSFEVACKTASQFAGRGFRPGSKATAEQLSYLSKLTGKSLPKRWLLRYGDKGDVADLIAATLAVRAARMLTRRKVKGPTAKAPTEQRTPDTFDPRSTPDQRPPMSVPPTRSGGTDLTPQGWKAPQGVAVSWIDGEDEADLDDNGAMRAEAS